METIIINNWYNSFKEFFDKSIEEGMHVIVIALSRKMPRLIDWILKGNQFDSSIRIGLLDLLSKCEYTTEHGIPFIVNQLRDCDSKVLILDDIVVNGDTIQSVCDEIKSFSDKTPYYLSLYSYKNKQKKINGNPIGCPKELETIKDVRDTICDLSKVIAVNNLPIDIEFPIVNVKSSEIQGNLYEDIKGLLEKNSPSGSRHYGIGSNVEMSYTHLMEQEINRAYNNDFAKIRLFRNRENNDEVKIVGYAPNMLSEDQLSLETLFENEKYAAVWNYVTHSCLQFKNRVLESYKILNLNDLKNYRINIRLHRSLAVLANYLFSFSMLVRYKDVYVKGEYNIDINVDDIKLLVGASMASEIYPRLKEFLKNGTVSTSLRRELDLPSVITIRREEGNYEFAKIMTLQKTATIREAILTIFNIGYKMMTARRGSQLYSIDSPYFMESYQSLYSQPRAMFRGKEAESEINKIIDEMIDNGYVIPVYSRVMASSGAYYWRRFFRPSHIIAMADKQ